MPSTALPKCSTCGGPSYDPLNNFVPCGVHCRLLASYLLNIDRGAPAVRDMMMHDIQGFRELGAHKQALDLAIVLECFLSEFPEATPR